MSQRLFVRYFKLFLLGFHSLSWLIPPAALLFGGKLVFFVLTGRKYGTEHGGTE